MISQSSKLAGRANKKVSFVCQTKETFLRDAFLAERDAHGVRDADFVCDARLRRVCGTHRITYHSAAASLITYLQSGTFHICRKANITLICILVHLNCFHIAKKRHAKACLSVCRETRLRIKRQPGFWCI